MRKKINKSRDHHWWPVGLQKYWQDSQGCVSCIYPNGVIERKRVVNRKVGRKANGHTLFKGTAWETNFESDFEAVDNSVGRVIESLEARRPKGSSIGELISLLRATLGFKSSPIDAARFYRISSDDEVDILCFLLSLTIRSPSMRDRHENYRGIFNLRPDENMGKVGINSYFRKLVDLCAKVSSPRFFFTIIRSPGGKFICGDGYFDHISQYLPFGRFSGRAIVPLTPKICVYVSSPGRYCGGTNCASIYAPSWMVYQINEVTQIYSRRNLFFLGSAPLLLDCYKSEKFYSIDVGSMSFLKVLDYISLGAYPVD